ncbi:fumarylacetoacetate hydrolase family protein [Flavonifractor sp. AGMB03687]|uniref:2-keto-4-pentenoate hydratase n=1 Tax=Flavonifractor sp. AGMB03687 TaxID=2785133 RepID=UPI001ADFFBF0|nr:fumarylacetoacetate hydrolase family protein [Flavonifractor sp. AGMB03687]
MALSKEILCKLVESSLDGEYQLHSIDPFCNTYPELTEEEAYQGQAMRLARMEEMGHRLVGYKLGGTSLAKQKQLASTIYAKGGLAVQTTKVVYGRLMDYMALAPEEDLSYSQVLHPKVEPELAFIMGQDIQGAYITAPDIMNATAWVAPAFEIIDSRFHDFKIGSRYDAIVDNTSSARFKLGVGRRHPNELDLTAIGMSLQVNGSFTAFGAGASVMGHPARAVAALARALAQEGLGLRAGDIILSGAITPSTPVKVGDHLRADFGGLGYVELTIRD